MTADVIRVLCVGATLEVVAASSVLFLTRLGNDAENRYIPRIWRDFFDPLAIESDTDQFRVKPVIPTFEKCECAIEITTAHTKTVSLVIESEERGDDDIESACINRITVYRLPEAEVTHRQHCPW